jgi:hypothetical protein
LEIQNKTNSSFSEDLDLEGSKLLVPANNRTIELMEVKLNFTHLNWADCGLLLSIFVEFE